MAVARRKALDSGERKERVPPGEGLGTVERVVEILRYFADRGESTLKELAEAVSLAPSNTASASSLRERCSTQKRSIQAVYFDTNYR